MYSKPPKRDIHRKPWFNRAPMAARFKKTTEQAPTICAIEQHLQMVWPTMSKLPGFNDIATYKHHSKSVFFFNYVFLKYLLAKSSSVFRGVLLLLKKGNNKCFKGIWGQAKTYCTAKLSRKNHPKMFRLLSFLKLATFQELSLKGYSPEN